MKAIDAKKLSDAAAAMALVRSYIPRIEEAAKRGGTSVCFGQLGYEDIRAFEMLGYETSSDGGNIRVTWKNAK